MNTKKLNYEEKKLLQDYVIQIAVEHDEQGLKEDLLACNKEEFEILHTRYIKFPKMPVEDFSAMLMVDENVDGSELPFEIPTDANAIKIRIYLYDVNDKIFDVFGSIEVFKDPLNLPENSFYRSFWLNE